MQNQTMLMQILCMTLVWQLKTYDYVKHQMCDVQQKKAKPYCFDQLDNSSGFWLKDFCQTLLPKKFREAQNDYFGKTGMSLHVDIFFTSHEGELQKHVYFTSLHRYNQDGKDFLSINENVLKQFKKMHQVFLQSRTMLAVTIPHTPLKHCIRCARERVFACYDMTIMNHARGKISMTAKAHLLKPLSVVTLMW